MKNKKPVIICDIDGTLANIDHRICHLEKTPKDWNTFNSLMYKDKPNRWCEVILTALHIVRYKIIFLTGRTEEYRKITSEWLDRNFIFYADPSIRSSILLMRKDDDFRKDAVVKKEIYERHIKPHYNVIFILEDRSRVVQMWRSLGLTCLQCKDGDY